MIVFGGTTTAGTQGSISRRQINVNAHYLIRFRSMLFCSRLTRGSINGGPHEVTLIQNFALDPAQGRVEGIRSGEGRDVRAVARIRLWPQPHHEDPLAVGGESAGEVDLCVLAVPHPKWVECHGDHL